MFRILNNSKNIARTQTLDLNMWSHSEATNYMTIFFYMVSLPSFYCDLYTKFKMPPTHIFTTNYSFPSRLSPYFVSFICILATKTTSYVHMFEGVNDKLEKVIIVVVIFIAYQHIEGKHV